MKGINIIFDGPPGVPAPRFVEVETDEGKSINVGEWLKKPNGYYSLRIDYDQERKRLGIMEVN